MTEQKIKQTILNNKPNKFIIFVYSKIGIGKKHRKTRLFNMLIMILLYILGAIFDLMNNHLLSNIMVITSTIILLILVILNFIAVKLNYNRIIKISKILNMSLTSLEKYINKYDII